MTILDEIDERVQALARYEAFAGRLPWRWLPARVRMLAWRWKVTHGAR